MQKYVPYVRREESENGTTLRKPDAFLLGEFVKYVLKMMREKNPF
jgi:hypothetical protein